MKSNQKIVESLMIYLSDSDPIDKDLFKEDLLEALQAKDEQYRQEKIELADEIFRHYDEWWGEFGLDKSGAVEVLKRNVYEKLNLLKDGYKNN